MSLFNELSNASNSRQTSLKNTIKITLQAFLNSDLEELIMFTDNASEVNKKMLADNKDKSILIVKSIASQLTKVLFDNALKTLNYYDKTSVKMFDKIVNDSNNANYHAIVAVKKI
jgi:hypothetical protein